MTSFPRLPKLLLALLSIALVIPYSDGEADDADSDIKRIPLANGFDFPCGDPAGSGEGYHLARGWSAGHPGEDWNGDGGGNSDRGDPVYCIGTGVVVLSGHHGGGWGNTVIVRHAYRDPRSARIEVIDSFYAHMERIDVGWGEILDKGEQVGTIGTNNGMYVAHLHFEMRHGPGLNIGTARPAFPRNMAHYHRPTDFIDDHRELQKEDRVRATLRIDQFQAK